ncbi:MAG TPA: diguanylate cyclase [Chthonomonadaceae bacterium]|nr:diguanylate cyclase [Chthonomonadaceae bacterium]
MRNLPRSAQLFLIAVCLLGTGATLGAILMPGPDLQSQRWEVILFLILTCLAGSKRVRLVPTLKDEDAGSMSLGFTITFAGILHFGPAAGVLLGATGCLASCLYPQRKPWHQLAFNVALAACDAWAAGVVLFALKGDMLAMAPVETFRAVIGSVLVYYAINTGGVAIIISCCTGKRAWGVWKETFLWTAPSYFAGASISTLAMMLLNRNAGIILLFIAPVAYLTYQSYAVYTARAEEKQKHIEELNSSQQQLAELYLATIKSLALAIDAKDQYTHQHILRVQRYAMATARHMGLSGDELEGLNTGALLHDIGKLGVPEYVLLKPGRLTDEEFAKIKKHPEIGAAILDPVHFPWPVLPVVKYHHEKWNGTGYPEGLKGEEIPLIARILAVADVYDALTSSRSYRNAWSHERTIETIKKDSGSHFDPKVVEAFLEVIDDVVAEMAQEGTGPLAAVASSKAPASKADQAARDIQRASSELWALYEVAQTLSSSLGLQETLDILARKLEAILPGTACLFLLKDEVSDTLIAQAVVGINQEFFAGSRTLNNESRSLAVARSRQTYLGEYDADDLLLTSSQIATWTPLRTALIVPIVHQGEVLGTINLYHPQPEAFGPHDQQLLEMIAERAAMALYNGLLYDRTRSHAFTDPLTGLYNVRYLTEYVEERCSKALKEREARGGESAREAAAEEDAITFSVEPQRAEDAFALLCLDLDSFKPINDNFGHQKGDQVLRDLSRIFLATVREGDIVARYGGDEFLIVLNSVGSVEAERMAGRLKQAVESYDPGLHHAKLGALRLGVSIGFACFPEEGQDCATLLSAADSKMYSDKTDRKLGVMAARNRVHSADESLPNLRQAA